MIDKEGSELKIEFVQILQRWLIIKGENTHAANRDHVCRKVIGISIIITTHQHNCNWVHMYQLEHDRAMIQL